LPLPLPSSGRFTDGDSVFIAPKKQPNNPQGQIFDVDLGIFLLFGSASQFANPTVPHGCNPQAVASHSGSLPGGDLLDVSATAPWVERFRYEILIQGLEVGYP